MLKIAVCFVNESHTFICLGMVLANIILQYLIEFAIEFTMLIKIIEWRLLLISSTELNNIRKNFSKIIDSLFNALNNASNFALSSCKIEQLNNSKDYNMIRCYILVMF